MAIAQVGGKKELTGRTDLEIEISNLCARLIATPDTTPTTPLRFDEVLGVRLRPLAPAPWMTAPQRAQQDNRLRGGFFAPCPAAGIGSASTDFEMCL